MLFKKKTSDVMTDERLDSVAIIMDGNGRWAKRRLLPRTAGHVAGAARVSPVLEIFRQIGVHYVTLYAFSTENWKRPEAEVNALMELLYENIEKVAIPKILSDGNFSLRFIGDRSVLSERLQKKMEEAEALARDRDYVCQVAFNYGGQDEIVAAANAALRTEGELTKATLSRHLYTAACPDPDLVIRTGGETRISNFLLWQSAYSEFYFTDTLWPDFGRKDILRAVRSFYGRNRRFGGLGKEGEQQ